MTETDRPRAELTKYAAEYREITERHKAVRMALRWAIQDAAEAGMQQVEIVRITGYTREQVRRIVAARQFHNEIVEAARKRGLLPDHGSPTR